MSRFITEDNELVVHFRSNDLEQQFPVYNDVHIATVCRNYLDSLVAGKGDYVNTAQELVVYMFRALLYREYKHIQSQVCFIVDDKGVAYDSNMRNASGIYPPSVYEDCCDILLGVI